MSIPEKHHFLPQFYLDRWAVDGRVYRYVRPLGAAGDLHGQWKAPAAVAYERNLYRLPDSRLAAIRADLATKTAGAPFDGLTGADFDNVLKATANRLLQRLVNNTDAESVVSRFDTYGIRLKGSRSKLLTSDRPITLSAMLVSPDAFMALPIAPDCLLLLARDPEIARSFVTQNPSALVEGINQAVVEQSVDVVIAADTKARAMVDRLFLRPQPGRILDTLGFIRRKSPYRDLRPKIRDFSRHRKHAMRYLGS